MGNAPSGHRLGAEDTRSSDPHQKLLTLNFENRTGLVFNLVGTDPPELKDALPKSLGSKCSVSFDVSKVASKCQLFYTAELAVGGRATEYDILSTRKSIEKKAAATAVDLRAGKKDQLFTVLASLPGGWFSSGSAEVACSLGDGQDGEPLQHFLSQRGQNGCCSWCIYPAYNKKGCFVADVRVVKTDTETVNRRQALLNALETPGKKRAASAKTEPQTPDTTDAFMECESELTAEGECKHDEFVEPMRFDASAHPAVSSICAPSGDTDAKMLDSTVSDLRRPVADVTSQKGSMADSDTSECCKQGYVQPSEGSALTCTVKASSQSVPGPATSAAKSPPQSAPLSANAPAIEIKQKGSGGAGFATYGPDGKLRGNKSAAIAVQAKAEAEQRRRELEQRAKEEAAEREFRRTFGQVVANQDAEFELGLLHDQVSSLQKEQSSLQTKVREMETSLESATQMRVNAETRLQRYGENPKIRAEAEKAAEAESELQEPLAEAKERLAEVQKDLAEKGELLALAAIQDDL